MIHAIACNLASQCERIHLHAFALRLAGRSQTKPALQGYPNRVGETYSVIFDPAHQWFYVPEMRVGEALLLKCYDSKTDGRARFPPHTAFTDPTTPPDALPRESIEIRALVFHAE